MLLCLDYESDIPIYQQICNQIVIGIADGELKDGDQLPTIRSLSDELGINMMTVSKAYQILKSKGFIYSGRRSGAFVKKPQIEGHSLLDSSLDSLKFIASEAKLKGMSLEDFVLLCSGAYESSDSSENGELINE